MSGGRLARARALASLSRLWELDATQVSAVGLHKSLFVVSHRLFGS